MPIPDSEQISDEADGRVIADVLILDVKEGIVVFG